MPGMTPLSGILVCPLITGASASSGTRNDGAKGNEPHLEKLALSQWRCISAQIQAEITDRRTIQGNPPNGPMAVYKNRQAKIIGYPRCNYSPMEY